MEKNNRERIEVSVADETFSSVSIGKDELPHLQFSDEEFAALLENDEIINVDDETRERSRQLFKELQEEIEELRLEAEAEEKLGIVTPAACVNKLEAPDNKEDKEDSVSNMSIGGLHHPSFEMAGNEENENVTPVSEEELNSLLISSSRELRVDVGNRSTVDLGQETQLRETNQDTGNHDNAFQPSLQVEKKSSPSPIPILQSSTAKTEYPATIFDNSRRILRKVHNSLSATLVAMKNAKSELSENAGFLEINSQAMTHEELNSFADKKTALDLFWKRMSSEFASIRDKLTHESSELMPHIDSFVTHIDSFRNSRTRRVTSIPQVIVNDQQASLPGIDSRRTGVAGMKRQFSNQLEGYLPTSSDVGCSSQSELTVPSYRLQAHSSSSVGHQSQGSLKRYLLASEIPSTYVREGILQLLPQTQPQNPPSLPQNFQAPPQSFQILPQKRRINSSQDAKRGRRGSFKLVRGGFAERPSTPLGNVASPLNPSTSGVEIHTDNIHPGQEYRQNLTTNQYILQQRLRQQHLELARQQQQVRHSSTAHQLQGPYTHCRIEQAEGVRPGTGNVTASTALNTSAGFEQQMRAPVQEPSSYHHHPYAKPNPGYQNNQ